MLIDRQALADAAPFWGLGLIALVTILILYTNAGGY